MGLTWSRVVTLYLLYSVKTCLFFFLTGITSQNWHFEKLDTIWGVAQWYCGSVIRFLSDINIAKLLLNSIFYKKGAKNFVVIPHDTMSREPRSRIRNLQKLPFLSDGVWRGNFCKFRATKNFLLLSYKKWTLLTEILSKNAKSFQNGYGRISDPAFGVIHF